MENRYNLTIEQNIFLAKKILAETVYNAIKLEGLNTTYVQTEKILNGINDGKVALDDVRTILNLKNGWSYILTNIDQELSFDFVCQINKRVSANESLDWGVLRYGTVGVRLVNNERFEPPIPEERDVIEKIEEIKNIENATDRALTYFLWAARTQLFWDGNKRTSNLVANFILIKNGCGILSVDEEDLDEFNKKLSNYYKTNNMEDIKQFLYDKAIKGMTIRR